jgi:hypothetical protein
VYAEALVAVQLIPKARMSEGRKTAADDITSNMFVEERVLKLEGLPKKEYGNLVEFLACGNDGFENDTASRK